MIIDKKKVKLLNRVTKNNSYEETSLKNRFPINSCYVLIVAKNQKPPGLEGF